jgi:hypothetical protein
MEVDGRMYSGDAKIADLVRERLQTKEKNQNGREMVGAESRKGKRDEEGTYLLPPSFRSAF